MADMYPDNKIVTLMDKDVLWPGLDPKTGKFTNGRVENGVAIPPSYIPAETVNLILDNFAELVKSLGGKPNNHGTRQAADAVSRFTAGVTSRMNAMEAACAEAISRFTAGVTSRMNAMEAACAEAISRFTTGVTSRMNAMETACGYRVFASTAATDTIRILFKAAEGAYFANISIATNDPRVFLKFTVTFNLRYSRHTPAISDLSIRYDSQIAIPGYDPLPDVSVDMWTNGSVVLSLKLPSGAITNTRSGLTTRLPALTATLWHGTVDGAVSKIGDPPVGQRNLEVIWFGKDLLYYGYGFGDEQSVFIGDLSFDWDDFVFAMEEI